MNDGRYLLDLDMARHNLYEINPVLARLVEWFCSIDSNIYNNKKRLLKYTKNDENIQYTKSFGSFNAQIVIYGNEEYYSDPKTKFYTKDNTLRIFLNIDNFITKSDYPFKSASANVYKKLSTTETYDDAYKKFIDNLVRVENYRIKMLNSLARFAGEYLLKDCIYDIHSKTAAEYITKKLNRLLYAYNKIITLNTLPGMGEVYFTILSIEEIADKDHKDEPFWLRSKKVYIDYKTLYFLRKYVFKEGVFKYQVRTGDDIEEQQESKDKYIQKIQEDFLYAYIIDEEDILVFSDQ